jgi:hypothetical protein
MTYEEYKGRKKRRSVSVVRNLSIACLTIGLMLFAVTAAMASKADTSTAAPAMPAMQEQMKATMQDMMVMMQNTAAWTPQGLVVLQGNRLLQYTPDLQLRQTITLPIPEAPAMPQVLTPNADGTQGQTEMPGAPPMRGLVSTRILSTDNGLLIVRGRQAIRLDGEFHIVGQVMLPDLPPLSDAELAAICPHSQQMMTMMNQGMPMGTAGMPGMASNSQTVAPPASAVDLPKFIVPGSLGRASTL